MKKNKVSSGTCHRSRCIICFILRVSGGPFLRFVARIFSVINNSCRTPIVGVQRQQGRVLTSDNDHHYPPLTSAAMSGAASAVLQWCRACSQSLLWFKHQWSKHHNCQTSNSFSLSLRSRLTHCSVSSSSWSEPGYPDSVPRLPITVTGLITCKLPLSVMHRPPAPSSAPWPPPPAPTAHRS